MSEILKRKSLASCDEILAVKLNTLRGPLLRCVRQSGGCQCLRHVHEILEEIPLLKHRPGPMVELHVENAEMRDVLIKFGAVVPECLQLQRAA